MSQSKKLLVYFYINYIPYPAIIAFNEISLFMYVVAHAPSEGDLIEPVQSFWKFILNHLVKFSTATFQFYGKMGKVKYLLEGKMS